ncbi:NfeD family protein [Cellulosimicrobium sp. BIT-GX5]|uniref:NfeD family protein n=2 Tax=Cellulosimicrobium composti TaxID=2672572 RepID=A0A6N7ZI53_9MICO|nr:NfeD family protein [Cellulosimicrobium composti]NDO88218.1 NfeD family protein [Cellulosimicrobium composti]TWG80083.1 membrane protein implicated in regulation of membrane protease activity [Cellulosimicrobium cellulans J34]SMF22041.1 Membrane protein implicated in regulation of membrane protease activity [Cellulosimicrobium cellulans J1]
MDWLWWVGAALLLGLVEIISLDLVLIMLAGGSLAAAGVNAAGGPLWLQIVAFAVVSVILLVTLRPWLLRHLRSRVPLTETNVAAHVGRTALAVDRVSEFGGRVKLVGEVWTARTEPDAPQIPAGAEVRVVRIDGATAVVAPLPAQHPTGS